LGNGKDTMKDITKIKRAMDCFNKIKIEVEPFLVEHSNNQDGEIVCIDGWILLVPVIVEENVRSIIGGCKHKVKRWSIEALTHRQGDRETPPEDDYDVVVENLSLENACKKAWDLITCNNVENVFEYIGYEEDHEVEATYEKVEGI